MFFPWVSNVYPVLLTLLLFTLYLNTRKAENVGFKLDPSIRILDFWGEGRILDPELNLITGFRSEDAYNVNWIHKQVSNGANIGKVIPNLIPTQSYENVDISEYVPDSSFQYVTVMGAPVIDAVAKEIYRVIKKDASSRIILYGPYLDIKEYLDIILENSPDFIYAGSLTLDANKDIYDKLPSVLREIQIGNAPNAPNAQNVGNPGSAQNSDPLSYMHILMLDPMTS
jgi:hypothetical protein